jgi:hypothetical protein
MVEKLENDKYQVNFWASQSESAAGPKPVFKFQVRVRSKLLQGLNPEAMSLLNDGTLPAPEAAKPSRRSRASRPSSPRGGVAPAGGDIQIGGGEPAPTPARTRRGRKAPGADAAAALLEGLKAGAKAAETPKSKAKAKTKASGDQASGGTELPPEDLPADEESTDGGKSGAGAPKSEEDEMLDQLLLPGLEKKTQGKKR